MSYDSQYETLLYQYEVLQARLKIREHYLGTVVKEVYENIGQMLSLIRVKLSLLRQGVGAGASETIDSSGEMVAQTINDLRNMCRLFYPEKEFINGSGIYKAIGEEVKAQFPEASFMIGDKNFSTSGINGEKGLVIFWVLLEIVKMISKKEGARIASAAINKKNNKLIFIVNYYGDVTWEKSNKDLPNGFDLAIFDRAELLGGRMQIKKLRHEARRIKLEVPIN